MAAAGFPVKPDGGSLKSVPTKTVISRLGVIIPEFSKERQDEATLLVGLRNDELHSSGSPLTIEVARWLPHFTRVVDVICRHLGGDPTDLLGEAIIGQGRALVDEADRKLEHAVGERIKAAQAFFEQLKAGEIDARRAQIPGTVVEGLRSPVIDYAPGTVAFEPVDCPGCTQKIPMELDAVRTTNERLEDEEIYRDVVYIAVLLSCPVCDLKLSSTAEIMAAKLPQQYVRAEQESLEDRYVGGVEPDYGND
jgi:hypothetical protein